MEFRRSADRDIWLPVDVAGPTEPVEGDDLAGLGVIAVQLALTFAEWVRRRRFVVSYVDDTTIHQRMSVDFQLPGPDWFWAPPCLGDRIYVPIYIARKETLDQFTAYDEDGRGLTMLGTTDNGALAIKGLFASLVNLAGGHMTESQLEDALERIVMAPKEGDHDPATAVFQPALDGPLGGVLSTPGAGESRALLEDLAGGFLMMLPIRYEPGADRLVKVEWDIPNYWHGRKGDNNVRLRAQSFLATIAWADKLQSIPDMQIGWARSTHVEVISPPDVQMSEVAMNVAQFDPKSGNVLRATPWRSAFNKPRATINVTPRTRFDPYASDASRRRAASQLVNSRGDTATVDVRFRSPASGVLAATAIAATLLSILMWVASEHLTQLDRQTFSAVLLVFPAILTAYLLRQGEHDFARRLLAGVRVCGLGVAICSVAMSAILGVAELNKPRTDPSSVAMDNRPSLLCMMTSARVGVGRSRRSELRSVTCQTRPGIGVEVNGSTRKWSHRLAAVASVLSGVLLIGLFRTMFRAHVSLRGKTEQYHPLPGAPASAPSA